MLYCYQPPFELPFVLLCFGIVYDLLNPIMYLPLHRRLWLVPPHRFLAPQWVRHPRLIRFVFQDESNGKPSVQVQITHLASHTSFLRQHNGVGKQLEFVGPCASPRQTPNSPMLLCIRPWHTRNIRSLASKQFHDFFQLPALLSYHLVEQMQSGYP